MKIIVLKPIEVPEGDYCWRYNGSAICENFSNEGGHETCDQQFYKQTRDNNGVLKAPKCKELKRKV